ncbi:MAG TPA: hypothetical protein VNN62_10725, partial [Methylomirabilota bacterium]|nr:hypothetical protein [Methylomirabilota bacterium]
MQNVEGGIPSQAFFMRHSACAIPRLFHPLPHPLPSREREPVANRSFNYIQARIRLLFRTLPVTTQRPHIDLNALLRFERKSIAAALNLIEDRRPARQTQALALLDELAALPAPAHIVGITGPPGVGKSSLISRLIDIAMRNKRRMGIVAVDPSSKVSGGAILGDRGRMQIPQQAPIYIRSFAARDRLGGLSREAFAAVFLLRHLCDVVLVETVGVGQSETDIAHIADTVVLIVQPFSGDLLQF